MIFNIHLFDSASRLSRYVVDKCLVQTELAIAEKGRCSWALSGGKTSKVFFDFLLSSPTRLSFPWTQIDVFWVDEEWVSRAHPDNPYHWVQKGLDSVPLPEAQRYPIPTHKASPVEAAKIYEKTLRTYFKTPGNSPGFDCMWLGMGEDGHTASLFPHSRLLGLKRKWVASAAPKDAPHARLTLTLPLINLSKWVCMMLVGSRKRPIFESTNPLLWKTNPRYPATLVRPKHGELEICASLSDR
jgi:6-phosphogluconolactonase